VEKFKQSRADQENELASGSDELRLSGIVSNFSQRNIWIEERMPKYPVEKGFELVSSWDRLLRFITSRKIKHWGTSDLEHWLSEEVIRVVHEKELKGKGWGAPFMSSGTVMK